MLTITDREPIIYRDDIPEECIADCSAPGDVSGMVAYWRAKLGLTVPRRAAVACCLATGAYENPEQDSDDVLADRILWFACCDFRENPDDTAYFIEG